MTDVQSAPASTTPKFSAEVLPLMVIPRIAFGDVTSRLPPFTA